MTLWGALRSIAFEKCLLFLHQPARKVNMECYVVDATVGGPDFLHVSPLRNSWPHAFRMSTPDTCSLDQWLSTETCGVLYNGFSTLLGLSAQVPGKAVHANFVYAHMCLVVP